MQVARLGAVRVDVRRVPLAGVRLHPDGRDLAGEPVPLGSHAGVSIGEDGPSQMALEDIAEFRARARQHRAASLRCQPDRQARAGRWPTATGSPTCARCAPRPACGPGEEPSAIGGSRDRAVERPRRRDARRVRHHRRRGDARGRGARGRRRQRPRDRLLLDQADRRDDAPQPRARETGAIITVEDHWPEGGLGDAVLEALAEPGTAPAASSSSPSRHMPGSGRLRPS